MIDHWAFIGVLALGMLTAPVSAHAQPASKVAKIGFVSFGTPSTATSNVEAFRRGLREHGYVEGQNIVVEYRFAEGRDDRLPEIAAGLVDSHVNLIVCSGARVLRALTRATSTIPIVVAVISDPVGAGFIASYARPGGKVTGLAFQDADLVTKRLELLKETLPGLSRVALLFDPGGPAGGPATVLLSAEQAGQTLGLKLQVLEVRAGGFQEAFEAAKKAHAEAIVQVASPLFSVNRRTLANLYLRTRLPGTCEQKVFVTLGCLMSYGPDFDDMVRRSAVYVDKILRGAKPGDLPIEQPTKFELVINLRTAKALGLTIPPSLLLRADQVIQ